MADYASELLKGAEIPESPQQGTDYATSMLRRGQFSESVMGRKIVPLQDRANVPEVGSLKSPGVSAALKYSAARTFKGDEDEAVANVLMKALPDAELLYDVEPETGRQVPYLSYKGKAYYLNKPGISGADFENIGGQMAAFMPAGRFAQGGTTLLRQAGRAAAGAGATSVAGDVIADLAGADTGINPAKAATNVALGPIAQVIGAKIYPLLQIKRISAPLGGMTPEAADALRRAGIDPGLLDANGIARIDEVVRRIGGEFSAASRTATQRAGTQGRAAIAEQEGIRLAQGQASGDVRQIAKEEAMRNYARGKPAGDTMRDFDTLQRNDITGAIQKRQAATGGGMGPTFGNEYEAGAANLANVRGAASALKGQVDEAYREAGERTLEFAGSKIGDLKNQVKAALSENSVALAPRTTPNTIQAQKLVDGIRNSMDVSGVSGPMGKWTKRVFEDVDFRDLEQVRRQLNSVYRSAASSPEDARGVKTVIRAFDQWIDDAVDAGLATGDEQAIAAIKRARELRTKYGTLFEERSYDTDAGRIFQRLLNTDVSPNEAMNLVFGHSELGQTPVSVRVAARMRDIFGAGSPEWNQYREAAFMRMIGGPQGQGGPQMIVSRIDRALDGRGMSLTREIFSPEEIQKLRSLRAAISQTIPPKGATNPSKTGYEVARLLEDALGRAGGLLGILKGDITGTAGALGVRAAKDAKGAVQARLATGGVPLPPQKGFSPAIGAAAAAGDEIRSRLWSWLSGGEQSSQTEAKR